MFNRIMCLCKLMKRKNKKRGKNKAYPTEYYFDNGIPEPRQNPSHMTITK